MPSNIDFSQFRPDPQIFKADDDWVNRMYQFAAKRDAGALYAQGDPAGAAKRLAVSGDIASASKLQGDEETRQFNRIKNSHDYITKQAAPLLSAIYAQHPEGLLPAFEQAVPEWKQAGATDAGVEQLRNAFKQNPKGTLEKLGGLGDVDVQKDGTDTVGLRKNTGEIVWRVKGAPKPPETVTYQEGKEKVTDFYENGVKTKTVRGPISEPLVQTVGPGGTGVYTPRGDAAGQPVYRPTGSAGGTQAAKDDATLAQGKRDTPDYYAAWWRRKSTPRYAGTDPATGEAIFYEQTMAQWPEPTWDPATGTPKASVGGPAAAPLSQEEMLKYLMANEGGTKEQWDEWAKGPDEIKKLYDQSMEIHGGAGAQSQTPAPQAAGTDRPPVNITRVPARTPAPDKTNLERDRTFLLTGDPSTAEYASRYATMARPQVSYDPQTGDRIVSTPDMSWARVPTFKGAAGAPAPGPARGAATGQPTVTAEPGRAASPARAVFEANVNQATEDTALAISRFFKGGPKGSEEKGVFQRSIAASGNIPLTNGRTASQAIRRAVEVLLRLRTGAAAPEQEVDRYTYDFSPSIFDTDEGARIKMQRMRTFFADMRRIGESNIRAGTWGTDKASLTGANTGGADVAPAGGRPKFIIEKVE